MSIDNNEGHFTLILKSKLSAKRAKLPFSSLFSRVLPAFGINCFFRITKQPPLIKAQAFF